RTGHVLQLHTQPLLRVAAASASPRLLPQQWPTSSPLRRCGASHHHRALAAKGAVAYSTRAAATPGGAQAAAMVHRAGAVVDRQWRSSSGQRQIGVSWEQTRRPSRAEQSEVGMAARRLSGLDPAITTSHRLVCPCPSRRNQGSASCPAR
uniref:Uncharacterized protein n=1 Tax=Triticum urartu TaxID=4572 RepID=A0A8R7QNA0_TRIUA